MHFPSGHQLAICPSWDQKDAELAVRSVFDGSRFGLLKATPAHFELLLAAAGSGAAEIEVGTVVIGGEPLSGRLARAVLATCSDTTVLVNEYGPTEATVGCVVYRLTRESAIPVNSMIPIGRPLANTEVFVLDAADRLVPVGVTGELHISGIGLARGYLNQPELTAQRFTHKHIGGRERRVYRTGDLVRWMPDGNLQFIGRTDNQVKLRGFRVELGEIEAALCDCPQIAEAVVTACADDTPGGKRLVAYVVSTDPAASPDIPAVRELLRARLPRIHAPGHVHHPGLNAPLQLRQDRHASPAAPRRNPPRPPRCLHRPPGPGPARHRAGLVPGPRHRPDRSTRQLLRTRRPLPTRHPGIESCVHMLTGFRISVKDFFRQPTVAAMCIPDHRDASAFRAIFPVHE